MERNSCSLNMRRSFYSFATLLVMSLVVFPSAAQTITPPNAPGMGVPYPYLYLNSPSHWSYMSPQNANPTT
jgi:hypothetical protein